MAMHTQNLRADPRASLLVTQPDSGSDVLGASRVTLLGDVLRIEEPEVAGARKTYLATYENSKYWVDFEDFSFYRMNVVDVYYVGGFGVMGWVDAAECGRAEPDPLSDAATEKSPLHSSSETYRRNNEMMLSAPVSIRTMME